MAAKTYARALLEVMKKEDLLGQLQEETRYIRDIVKNKGTQDYLANRSVARKDKMEAFISCHPVISGFLNVVMDYKNEKELYGIFSEYMDLLNQQLGELDVEVVSSVTLSNMEKERLGERLQKKMGKKLNITYTKDCGIIGGLVIKYGHNVIDGSVKGTLAEMLKNLTGETHEK